MAASAVTPPCFFVSVRGAPRCSVEAQQRAAAETEAVLSALLPRQQLPQQQQLLQPSHPPPEQGTTGFSKVDVAHRGAFVMQLPPHVDASALYAAVASAITARTAAEAIQPSFQFAAKFTPIQSVLAGEDASVAGLSACLRLMLAANPLPTGKLL